MSDGSHAIDGAIHPLSKIFGNDKFYLIDMTRNLRGYSWGKDRVLRLLEDIRAFEGEEDDEMYDLGPIILTKARKFDLTNLQKDAVGKRKDCGWYHAHDGQQRLTSIFILLIALLQAYEERKLDFPPMQRNFVQQRIYDLKSAVNPKTKIGGRVPRIVSTVSYMRQFVDFLTPEETAADEDPQKVVTKKRTIDDVAQSDGDEKETDPEEAKRVIETYTTYKTAIDEMNLDELNHLCDNVSDSTQVLICVMASDEIAQRKFNPASCNIFTFLHSFLQHVLPKIIGWVMNQRHGLNIENVDFCKGYLCRNENVVTKVQIKTERRWNQLCLDLSRRAVYLGAIMLAQIDCGKPLRDIEEKEAVDLFEKFVDKSLSEHSCEIIFDRIEAAAWKLHYLTNPSAKPGRPSPDSGQIKIGRGLYDGMSDTDKVLLMPSIRFLVGFIASKTAAGKALEIATLAILLNVKSPSRAAKLMWYLERIALWMLLAAPNKKDRTDRIFKFINEIRDDSDNGENDALDLSSSEKAAVRKGLEESEVFSLFGQSNKIPKAILERLNVYHSRKDDPTFVVDDDQVFVEAILVAQGQSKYRLGCLVVTSSKVSRNSKFNTLNDKKTRCSGSPFPLSKLAANNLTPEGINSLTKAGINLFQYYNTYQILEAADELWDLHEVCI